jgi:hypothetical protein
MGHLPRVHNQGEWKDARKQAIREKPSGLAEFTRTSIGLARRGVKLLNSTRHDGQQPGEESHQQESPTQSR